MVALDDVALTNAVCALLDSLGLGEWRPAGPVYTAAETGIFYGAIGATPDRAIGVSVYATDDDVVTGEATRWAQLRYRGPRNAPNGADTIAGAVFTAVHGTYHAGGIARLVRTSSAPLGADGNGRQERADNYQIILDNPEA